MPLGRDLHAFIERRRTGAEQLYSVVDSARDPDFAQAVFESFGLERWSLFPTDTAPHMAAVAPYLVPVPFETKYPYTSCGYLDAWAERLGTNAGILLTTAAATRVLWEHLQRLFLAVDEQGTEFFFRFYDPRVLRGVLAAFSAAEGKQFFGPVKQIFVEGEAAGEFLASRIGPDGIRIERQRDSANDAKRVN